MHKVHFLHLLKRSIANSTAVTRARTVRKNEDIRNHLSTKKQKSEKMSFSVILFLALLFLTLLLRSVSFILGLFLCKLIGQCYEYF